ncbi:MAG: helix-turn-helix transcriptional regulator [Oscillospiraceae bacterium]
MNAEKNERCLAIFLRGIRGEKITVSELAEEYGVSAKSISRDIGEIRCFLAENRELAGHAELIYDRSAKCYTIHIDDFLRDSELLAIIKVLIGSRAFSRQELLGIIGKLGKFTSTKDRMLLENLIAKEKYHYCEVKHDCSEGVVDMLWKLANDIRSRTEITITYYKMNRDRVTHTVHPVSIMFSEYYFYLIAYKSEDESRSPVYFRVDRITSVVEHRTKFTLPAGADFDEGELRKKIQFMFPGVCRKIRFEFCGPSLQAVLDRLPTAVVLDINDGKALIEAEVYGTGIMMYLLSQGSWVRVLAPQDFVEEYKAELQKMLAQY